MMQFSRRLISKGIKSTLVTSIFIAKAMKLGSSIGPVHLDVISDGFDEEGFPKGGSSELYLENLEAAAPVSIPGLPLLESRDMTSFIDVPGLYPAYLKMLLDQFSNTDRVDYILINTFYKLEAEAVDTISKVCPTLMIGLTVPSVYLDQRKQVDKRL
ncbi:GLYCOSYLTRANSFERASE [Salix koriyanagi]|uniref:GLYCOSYLTRANSFERASE n=1 Tax=Salix koriyanagi TaxID=2511006 RepID=A0A9Q0UP76_9ROSI|nr:GLYCOSYLTRANSFERASE [Salix koriyanagi]